MAEPKKLWSNTEIQKLIAVYEDNPVLWDVHSVDYRDRDKKHEILNSIATQFNTDVSEITRKLHNLRSQFMQELKKIKKKKSGAATEEVYISNWPYFSALKFIQRSVDNPESTDNLHCSTQKRISEKDSETSAQPESQPQTKRKKINNDNIISQEIQQKAVNLLNQPMDDEQIFGDYVASEMRQIKHPANKRRFKRLINEAIMHISEEDAREQEFPNLSSLPSSSSYSSSTSNSTSLEHSFPYNAQNQTFTHSTYMSQPNAQSSNSMFQDL